jgi:hypothetical protein
VPHRRELSRLIVAAVALAGAVVVASPAGGVTKPTNAWKVTGVTTPVASGWLSLACPTATACLGLAYTDANGTILERSTDGGQSFTVVSAPFSNATTVACATAQFCVVAGAWQGPGTPAAVSYVTTNGGVTWKYVALPGTAPGATYNTSLGCSTTTCYLVASASSLSRFASITAAGHAWTNVTLPITPDAFGALIAVGCGGGRCVVVGSNVGYTTGLLFESDAGGPWVETLAPSETHAIARVYSIACSSYSCAAFGASADSTYGYLLNSAADGTWQGLGVASFLSAKGVACTASNCFVAGGNWDVGGLAAWTLSGVSPQWTSATLPVGEAGQVFQTVACPTAARCLAGANRLYEFATGTSAWTDARVLDGTSGFVGISCPTPLTCVGSVQLGDGRVATRTTVDGGEHWGRAVPIRASDGFPYGVTCVGSICLIDGYDVATNLGWYARSTDDGRHWTFSVDPMLAGSTALLTWPSCATSLTCITSTGFGLGTFARTTNGGTTWSQVIVSVPGSSTRGGVMVQCMSAVLCLATQPTGTGVERLVSHDAGASWSFAYATRLSLSDTSLSCTHGGTCVLTGVTSASHLAVELRSTNAGATWVRIATPHESYGSAISSTSTSCWSAMDCEVAFSSAASSQFATTSNGGKTWATVPMLHGVSTVAIACSAEQCSGLGATGARPTTTREAHP